MCSRSRVDLGGKYPLSDRTRTQNLQRRSARSFYRSCPCHQGRAGESDPQQQTVPDREPAIWRGAVRCRAVLESCRLPRRKPGEADHRPAMDALEAHRRIAGLLPHARGGARKRLVTATTWRATMRWSCNISICDRRPARAPAQLRIFTCSGSSTTGISKIFSATIPRLSSSWRATMCGKPSSFASFYLVLVTRYSVTAGACANRATNGLRSCCGSRSRRRRWEEVRNTEPNLCRYCSE